MQTKRLVYEGSVKNLWEVGSDCLEFEYTDAYSVFDWGRMPDAIPRKGEALAALGAFFFGRVASAETWRRARLTSSKWLAPLTGRLRELVGAEIQTLEREGLKHHFVERGAPNCLTVRRVAAVGPVEHKLAGQTIHHYSGQGWEKRVRLIPLEVVFRLGVPKGSGLLDRLNAAYAAQLGLSAVPGEGTKLDRPIVEFFTKLEDTDRFLTWEQALNYSGLDYPLFERLVARTFCLTVWLAGVFEPTGLELWDGKFEWAVDDGELMLVDSIGPDELRLLDPRTGTQISKEFLRQFYRDTPWFAAVKQAKVEAAADPAMDWKDTVLKRVGGPPTLSKQYHDAALALYPSLALAVCGENPGGLGVALPQILERIRACAGR